METFNNDIMTYLEEDNKVDYCNFGLVNNEIENSTAFIGTLNRDDANEFINESKRKIKFTWTTLSRFYLKNMSLKGILNRFLEGTRAYGISCPVMPDQPLLVKNGKDTGEKIRIHSFTSRDFDAYYNSDDYKKTYKSIWYIFKRFSAVFMTKKTCDEVEAKHKENPALAYPNADCAVVRFHCDDPDFIGLAHCDAVHVTKGLIYACGKYMKNYLKTKPSKVKVFVSPSAYEGWTYDKIPDFAQRKDKEGNVMTDEKGIPLLNDQWMNYFNVEVNDVEENGKICHKITAVIKYGQKIYDQLLGAGFLRENIYISPYNTLEDQSFFSNSRAFNARRRGDFSDTDGRNLSLIGYKTEKTKKKSLRAC